MSEQQNSRQDRVTCLSKMINVHNAETTLRRTSIAYIAIRLAEGMNEKVFPRGF